MFLNKKLYIYKGLSILELLNQQLLQKPTHTPVNIPIPIIVSSFHTS